jgi:hypothetical protein
MPDVSQACGIPCTQIALTRDRRSWRNALVLGVDHRVKERRMLLDDYLPEFDVRTSYATRIAASPARVYASLWTANFDHWGVTRALYAVRTLPSFPTRPRETWRRFRDELFRQRFTLDGMLSRVRSA